MQSTLTLFGMGFVFVFLALMVVVTSLMSSFVLKIQPSINVSASMTLNLQWKLMKETRAIIEAAIKLHTRELKSCQHDDNT